MSVSMQTTSFLPPIYLPLILWLVPRTLVHHHWSLRRKRIVLFAFTEPPRTHWGIRKQNPPSASKYTYESRSDHVTHSGLALLCCFCLDGKRRYWSTERQGLTQWGSGWVMCCHMLVCAVFHLNKKAQMTALSSVGKLAPPLAPCHTAYLPTCVTQVLVSATYWIC